MVPEDTLSFGPQTQRYVRAQKTRSKCRRCFTVLHHHTSLFRLTSPLHNSKFRQTKRRQNFPGYIHILNPGSSIPDNSEFQKTGKNRSCSDCSCPDLKHHYCLDHLPSPPLKHPFLFGFMRICGGNFRTEEQKNGSPESFWMRPFRRGGQGILMTLE